MLTLGRVALTETPRAPPSNPLEAFARGVEAKASAVGASLRRFDRNVKDALRKIPGSRMPLPAGAAPPPVSAEREKKTKTVKVVKKTIRKEDLPEPRKGADETRVKEYIRASYAQSPPRPAAAPRGARRDRAHAPQTAAARHGGGPRRGRPRPRRVGARRARRAPRRRTRPRRRPSRRRRAAAGCAAIVVAAAASLRRDGDDDGDRARRDNDIDSAYCGSPQLTPRRDEKAKSDDPAPRGSGSGSDSDSRSRRTRPPRRLLRARLLLEGSSRRRTTRRTSRPGVSRRARTRARIPRARAVRGSGRARTRWRRRFAPRRR